MSRRYSRYIGGLITSCIVLVFLWSLDVTEYQAHHEKNVEVSGEQQYLTDMTLKTGPISEYWIQNMIDRAEKRVWVGVYTFTLPNLRESLLRAQKRGIDVRVILEQNPFGNTSINRESLQFFDKNMIQYHESNAHQFAFMHAKYMIIDSDWIIETANWTRSSFAVNREFFMTGRDPDVLNNLENIFQKDFQGKKGASNMTALLAGPTNARERLIKFLTSSQKTIDIYVPEFSDGAMIEELNTLCMNGISVRILLATYDDENQGEKDYGNCIQSRYMKQPLHAKVLLRDQSTAFIGSFNYTKNSLEKNREIGLFVSGENVKSISQTFESDWKQARIALP